MAGYKPLHVSGYEGGLVQSREEFILPNDAYPVLQNAFVWRERIKRKQGLGLLGRLRRVFTGESLGNSGASPWTFNIYSTLVPPITPEATASIEPGSVEITIGAIVFTDNGDGTLSSVTLGNSGVINYQTGDVTLTHTAGGGIATTIDFSYFPGLPVMGIRSRELNSINVEQTIVFDTVYAYRFIGGGYQEFIPGTTWTGTDSEFFWTTNFWVGDGNLKIFWATNFSGVLGDPIRYTNGSAWADFSPTINSGGDVLAQCQVMLPFRGRLVVGNTLEGPNLAGATAYPNRIRWAAIGTPFSDVSAIVTTVNANAWRDDIRGQGGYLDIPTSEAIVSFGFVRDNLVVFCERSTWQLRYTGRTIAPFQIEKVNTELGAESTFSAVQFDTSLVGIGDKGIVECDSFKSTRIDVKIPDLVFSFNNLNNGLERVQGIRDFIQKLAYWTYPFLPEGSPYEITFPNRRLVYNYENDSWAIFTDSITALGTFQPATSLKWEDFSGPNPGHKWENCNFTWIQKQALQPDIIGGNQQGYTFYLDWQVSNDQSLYISNITGGLSTTRLTVTDHNLLNGDVIQVVTIPSTDPFFSINDGIYGIVAIDKDTIDIYTYSSSTDDFDIPVVTSTGTYIGGGQIAVRDNFIIQSKKFNFLDQGENIQMGFIDILANNTDSGAFTLNVYVDYDTVNPVNRLSQNNIAGSIPTVSDPFFNSVIPTSRVSGLESTKNWKRVFCPVRGAFITIEWTLSNSQLNGSEQESDVQIDSQILYLRRAGRQLPVGV